MNNNEKIHLFNETDAILVYIASEDYSKEILGKFYNGSWLYIHVGRDKGSVTAYEGNDPNKIVPLNMKDHEYILSIAEMDR